MLAPGRSANLNAISRLGISSWSCSHSRQPARAFDDDVFQADPHGDLVIRRQQVVLEAEQALHPGEQAVDDVDEVSLAGWTGCLAG